MKMRKREMHDKIWKILIYCTVDIDRNHDIENIA
jgi:hypothetical protein